MSDKYSNYSQLWDTIIANAQAYAPTLTDVPMRKHLLEIIQTWEMNKTDPSFKKDILKNFGFYEVTCVTTHTEPLSFDEWMVNTGEFIHLAVSRHHLGNPSEREQELKKLLLLEEVARFQ